MPVVFINVGGKQIVPDVKTPGRIKIVDDGRPVLDSPMGIEVRGAFSLSFEKKNYGFELRDEAMNESPRPVLGMPAESDWVLYGCFSDKSYLRNALTYAIGRELGRYNPRARFVEVFIDDRYWGVYLLVEKVKRDKNRVALPEVAPDPGQGDITGGYIFRKEREGKAPAARNWTSKAGTIYTYHYPRHDRITPAQKNYLVELMDRFEAVWQGPEWNHPTRGYRAWIDLGSWVDYSIICELSFNPDCYRKSVYLQKEPQGRGGLLRHHPLWDFDLGYASTGITQTTDFLLVWGATNYASQPLNVRQISYWTKLWSDPAFQTDFKCRYQQLRKGPLSNANMRGKIDAWVTLLAEVEKRDHTRWPVLNVQVDCCSRRFATYAQAVDQLRTWIDARLRWLDPAVAKFPGTCP